MGVLVRTAHKNPVCRNLHCFFVAGQMFKSVSTLLTSAGLILRGSRSSLMQNNRFSCLISTPFKRNAPYDRYPNVRNFEEE